MDTTGGRYKNTDETVKISSARVEGCGCFYIYSSKNGRRAAALIRAGQELSRDEIGFSKVKSLKQVTCEKNAMPVWGVIITVLLVVALVGIISVIVIRKLRKYRELSQNSTLTNA